MGESGGVRGRSTGAGGCCEDRKNRVWVDGDMGENGRVGMDVVEGGLYVMPTALWTPETSNFAGMNEIVASPGAPPGTAGGM